MAVLLLALLATASIAGAINVPHSKVPIISAENTRSEQRLELTARRAGPANTATGTAVNITVYRITPLNYTGLDNFDTGDGAGDAFFGLYELSFPIICNSSVAKQHSISCINEPILNIPGYNVYTEFLLEADTRMGAYNECNPNPNTGVFSCVNWAESRSPCWHSDPRYKETFKDVCHWYECHCDAIEKLSVGHERCPICQPPTPGPPLPAQCTSQGGANAGYRVKRSVEVWYWGNTSLSDCCSRCNEMGYETCKTWSYDPTDHDTPCRTYRDELPYSDYEPSPTATVGSHSSAQKLFNQIEGLAAVLNGSWYSTQTAGKCKKGQIVGKDCWWRIAETKRTVNASCVNNNLINNVRALRPSCFKACPGNEGTNISSACFVTCLFEALAGDPHAHPPLPPLTKEQIVAPFVNSFDAPSKGGCPEVPIDDEEYMRYLTRDMEAHHQQHYQRRSERPVLAYHDLRKMMMRTKFKHY